MVLLGIAGKNDLFIHPNVRTSNKHLACMFMKTAKHWRLSDGIFSRARFQHETKT